MYANFFIQEIVFREEICPKVKVYEEYRLYTMAIPLKNPDFEFHIKGVRVYEYGVKEEYFLLYTLIESTHFKDNEIIIYLNNGLKLCLQFDTDHMNNFHKLHAKLNTTSYCPTSEQTFAPVQASTY